MVFGQWNFHRQSRQSLRSGKKHGRRLATRRSGKARKRLTAEILEDRRVLSASPGTATFDSGSGILTICGDDSANNIVISQDSGGTNILVNADFLTGQQSFALADVNMIMVTGAAGDDVIFAQSISVSMNIDGGSGNDTIVGGTADDTLTGGDGNDTISGRAGNDMIMGGGGNDRLMGQDGDDQLQGGTGEDRLFGHDGNDLMNGNEDNDLFYGGAGDDTINGDAGADRAFGGAGNDTINGGADDDRLTGDSGNDTIRGGLGADILLGGADDDTLEGGDGNDIVVGGTGDDQVFGQAGSDILCGDEGDDVLDGGLGSDALLSGAGDDILNGQDGNDLLMGGGGADTLNGNAGNDVLRGGDGRDVVIGGLGADRVNGVALGDIVIGGISGIDNDATMLATLISGWNNSDNYATRVAAAAALLGNAPISSDDGAIDRLRGETGDDYFLVHSNEDLVLNQDDNERVDGRALFAANDEYSAVENTTLMVSAVNGLLLNDTDPLGETLTVNTTPFTDADHGTVTLNSDGSFTYEPDADFVGMDLFIYEISNESSETALGSVTIMVNAAANSAPVAQDDSYTTDEDVAITAVLGTDDLLQNDSDPDGDALSVNTTPMTDVANGTLELNSDGTFTYTPADDFNGTDSFVYEVTDGTDTSMATATITVNPISDPPIAVADEYTIAPDTTLMTEVGVDDILLNDSDPDGDSIRVTTIPIADVNNGTLTLAADGTFTYTPDAGYIGIDTFIYEIVDETGARDQATVAINVINNVSPIANDDAYTIDEDVVLTTVLGTDDLLLNDTDANGDDLTVVATPITDVTNGTLVLNTDGTFIYTPNANFNGSDSFVYEISDGNGGTSQATATITIEAVADNPIAGDDEYDVDMGTTLTVPVGSDDLLQNDTDADGDTLTINTTPVTLPANGTLTLGTDGSFTYEPDDAFSGTDTFEYQVEDGMGGTDTATVTINVNIPNDDPLAVDDSYSVNEDGSLTTVKDTDDLLVNDSDPDGDTLTINTTPIVDVANGTLTIMADGTFTYTPDADFNGTDQFTYEISDGNGGSDQAVATITVDAVEDAPVAVDDSYSLDVDTSLTINPGAEDLLANDFDADGDMLTVNTTPITDVTNGTLSLNNDGSFTYTPDAGFVGTDSFEYEVSDGDGDTDDGMVTIEVVDPNSAPVAMDDMYNVDEDTMFSTTAGVDGLLMNDSDPDGDSLSVSTTPTEDPENGVVVIQADGSFTYTPALDFHGVDTFSYEVLDGNGGSSTATATINVASVNDEPIAANDNYTVNADTTLAALNGVNGLIDNDFDADGDNLVVNTTPTMDVANGMLTLLSDGSFTYIPDAGYVGTDRFAYLVEDGNGGSSEALVTIQVNADSITTDAIFDDLSEEESTELEISLALIDAVFGEGSL